MEYFSSIAGALDFAVNIADVLGEDFGPLMVDVHAFAVGVCRFALGHGEVTER